jgi:TPP-dependent pyruvate/acetoin dehydrogenase alpha subunit
VFALHEATHEALASIRHGAGPYFLECPTYRWKEHVGPGEDFHVGYRSIEDASSWMERDQVTRTGALLAISVREAIESAVDAEIAEAFLFAEASPFPADDELMRNTYAD